MIDSRTWKMDLLPGTKMSFLLLCVWLDEARSSLRLYVNSSCIWHGARTVKPPPAPSYFRPPPLEPSTPFVTREPLGKEEKLWRRTHNRSLVFGFCGYAAIVPILVGSNLATYCGATVQGRWAIVVRIFSVFFLYWQLKFSSIGGSDCCVSFDIPPRACCCVLCVKGKRRIKKKVGLFWAGCKCCVPAALETRLLPSESLFLLWASLTELIV